MNQTGLKRGASRARNAQPAKKSAKLRALAPATFRGPMPVKVIDAAIKTVMAARKPAAKQAVQIVLPGARTTSKSAHK